MWNLILNFLDSNKSSIIVSIIVGLLFFILGPLGLWFSDKKVKREKINKAVSELLDLFESMLVNKEKISISKLLTLYRAIERQNSVDLALSSDLNNVLEDLSLRFAKSKHLSSDQKDLYQIQIDSLINDLHKKEQEAKQIPSDDRELPKSLKSIITNLREEAKELNSEKINQQLDQLEKRFTLNEFSEPLFNSVRVLISNPKIFALVILFYVIVVAGILYYKHKL